MPLPAVRNHSSFLLAGVCLLVLVSVIFGSYSYRGYVGNYPGNNPVHNTALYNYIALEGDSGGGSYGGDSGSYSGGGGSDSGSYSGSSYSGSEHSSESGGSYSSSSGYSESQPGEGAYTPAEGTHTYTDSDGQAHSYTVTGGSTPDSYTYTYTDPQTGQSESYEYTYSNGEYRTENRDGNTYEYNSADHTDATYDSSAGTYSGETHEGESWTYNPATGEYAITRADGTVETGVHAGPGGEQEGQVVISEDHDGAAYTFDRTAWVDETYTQAVDNWAAYHDGVSITDAEKDQIRSELESRADRYSQGQAAYAEAIAQGLPVDQVESDSHARQYTDNFMDYETALQNQLGAELTEAEKQAAYARWEEMHEEATGEITHTDYFEETYENMNRYYEENHVPESQRMSQEDFNTMQTWRREYAERLATGESSTDLAREFHSRYDQQFAARYAAAPPREAPVPGIAQQISNEFSERISALRAQGISLDSSNPLANDLRTQMQIRFNDLAGTNADQHIAFVQSDCTGEVGDAQDACGKQVDALKDIKDRCGGFGGESATACYAVLEHTSRLDCTSANDPASCASAYDRLRSGLSQVTDPASRPVFVHEAETLPEERIAWDIYTEWKSCSAGGSTDCDSHARDRARTELSNQFSQWNAQWGAMNDDEKAAYKEQWANERSTYDAAVQARFDSAAVPPILQTRFIEQEENRIGTMDRFIAVAKEKGKDVARLEFYRESYADFVDTAQRDASNRQFRDMAADLQSANTDFKLFVEDARDMAGAGERTGGGERS